jgi:hypothetical protein
MLRIHTIHTTLMSIQYVLYKEYYLFQKYILVAGGNILTYWNYKFIEIKENKKILLYI